MSQTTKEKESSTKQEPDPNAAVVEEKIIKVQEMFKFVNITKEDF